jgi:hypothetical protein
MKECPIIIFLTYLFQLIVSMQSTQSIKYSTFENFGIFRYSTIENLGIFCTFPLIFGILWLHLHPVIQRGKWQKEFSDAKYMSKC